MRYTLVGTLPATVRITLEDGTSHDVQGIVTSLTLSAERAPAYRVYWKGSDEEMQSLVWFDTVTRYVRTECKNHFSPLLQGAHLELVEAPPLRDVSACGVPLP